MSRGGYLLPALREGQRLGDAKAIDMVLGVLTDPFGNDHMGLTAENVAKKFAINREQQDAFAVQSHTRSAEALAEGRFDSQIVPVKVPGKKGITVFDRMNMFALMPRWKVCRFCARRLPAMEPLRPAMHPA